MVVLRQSQMSKTHIPSSETGSRCVECLLRCLLNQTPPWRWDINFVPELQLKPICFPAHNHGEYPVQTTVVTIRNTALYGVALESHGRVTSHLAESGNATRAPQAQIFCC